jgi:ribosomal 50S subunit-associated protein YjgA (DUF615 family)
MSTKNDLSRITLDIPRETHQRLKLRAAIVGKSMRQVILEAIESMEECLQSDHYPNEKTLKAIENIEKSKNLIEIKKIKDLLKIR